jgi:mRNA interferase RelE/StbE
MYGLEFSNNSKKFLKGLDRNILIGIFNRLDNLKNNPIPSDSKFIGRDDNDKIFRYRIGKFRVLYKVKEKDKIILITKIDKRSRIYD